MRGLTVVLSCGSLHIAKTYRASLFSVSTFHESPFQVLSLASAVFLSSTSIVVPRLSIQLTFSLSLTLFEMIFRLKGGFKMSPARSLYSYFGS